MKLNLSYPLTAAQKIIECDDEKKIAVFIDKKMGNEIDASFLGDDFNGYVFRICGGNDKDGFPMRQGVMVKGRVRLLLSKGQKTYRPRRNGERKRKSVRGCIVGHDICVLALSLVKKGEKEIEGFTNVNHPRRLGPKRANKIRKLYGLKKTESSLLVKNNAIRRTFTSASGKQRQKAPKIQRLITSDRIRRKKIGKLVKKQNWEKSKLARVEYDSLVKAYKKANDRKRTGTQQLEEAVKDKKPVDQKKKEVTKTETKDTKKAQTKAPAKKETQAKEQPKETKKADNKKTAKK